MVIRLDTHGLLFFPDYSVPLQGLRVFYGGCGTGKSAIVTAFSLLNAISQRSLGDWTAARGNVSALFHQGPAFTPEIALTIERDQEQYLCILRQHPDNPNTLILKREQLVIREKGEENQFETIEVRTGDTESIFGVPVEESDEPVYRIMAAMSGWWVGHVSPHAIRNPGAHDTGRNLFPTGRNLIPFLISLSERDSAAFSRLSAAVASVCPDFIGFVIIPGKNGSVLMYESHTRPVLIPFTYFSDGMLRFICYAALFVAPDLPECMVIDDLETGLDELQLIQLLRLAAAAADRTGIVITTRSAAAAEWAGAEAVRL